MLCYSPLILNRRSKKHLFVAKTELPSKQETEDQCEEINSEHAQPHHYPESLLHTLMPSVTNFQEKLWVVRYYTIELFPNTPSHSLLIIDGPGKDRTLKGLGFLDECATPWCHEHCLEKIERDIWDFEEVAGVEEGEADVGDGESREVVVAERQIFRCPAT